MAGLAGGLPRRHPVQGDRDGAHVILGQHQPEQLGELLQLHGGLPQQPGALLQAQGQDVPQLPVLLGQGGLTPALQLLHPGGELPRQVDLLQKRVKGDRLPLPGGLGIFPQLLQGGDHPAAQGVQPGHQGPVLLRPGHAVALGVPGPVLALGPAAPPDVPFQHVVLQLVPVRLGQIGEAGLEIPEQVVIPIAPRRRLQGPGDQGQHRPVQDVRLVGGEHRHPIPGEHRLHQIPVGPVVSGHHADLPEAVPLLPGQAADAGGGPLHLSPGVAPPEQLHRPAAGAALGRLRGKQLPLTADQGGVLSGAVTDKVFYFIANARPAGQADQLGGGFPGGGKDARPPLVLLQAVTGEGNRQAGRLGHELLQHQPLLGREVGEAVQPQVLAPGPGAVFQLVRRPGKPVPGVQGAAGGEGLILPAEEPQVPELLPLRPGGGLPRLHQGLRGDAGAFQLVHRGQEGLKEGGPAGGAAVHLQLALHVAHRPVHEQQPAAGVQLLLPQAPRRLKDPVGQTAEGEHLGVQADGGPSRPAQGPLGLVGLLLGHHEHLGALRPRPAQPTQHGGGLARPGPAQNQLQHGGPSSLGVMVGTLYHSCKSMGTCAPRMRRKIGSADFGYGATSTAGVL